MHPLVKNVPLLKVLCELKGYQRQILLEALDTNSTKTIKKSLALLLKKGHKLKCRDKIQSCIKANKKCLGIILSPSGQSLKRTKKELVSLGGNPLLLLLASALPLILDLIKK